MRVFAVRMKNAWVLSYPLSAQRRLWSDWANAQADLSLRRAHMLFCRFCHALGEQMKMRECCPLMPPRHIFTLHDIFISHYLYRISIQSTLVISKSKGLSELLRDIHTATYQNCRIKEKINRTTTFNKCICDWTLEIRDILKILRSNFSSFPQYFITSC